MSAWQSTQRVAEVKIGQLTENAFNFKVAEKDPEVVAQNAERAREALARRNEERTTRRRVSIKGRWAASEALGAATAAAPAEVLASGSD